MQWVQDPNQSNVNNLNNVRHEVNRHCKNKIKEHLKANIDELENKRKIKYMTDFYRGINDFKNGCQPIPNIVRDEKGDLQIPTVF